MRSYQGPWDAARWQHRQRMMGLARKMTKATFGDPRLNEHVEGGDIACDRCRVVKCTCEIRCSKHHASEWISQAELRALEVEGKRRCDACVAEYEASVKAELEYERRERAKATREALEKLEAERQQRKAAAEFEQECARALREARYPGVRPAPKFREYEQRIIADAREAALEFAGILGSCVFISDDDRLGFETKIGERVFASQFMLDALLRRPQDLTLWFGKYAEAVMVERQREIFARVPQSGEVLGRLKWKMAVDQACPACGYKLDDPSWVCATCQPHKHRAPRIYDGFDPGKAD